MKYQIILESDEILPDDEFLDEIENSKSFKDFLQFHRKQFKLLYAQNLDGIRKELYEQKEYLKDALNMTVVEEETIENTFNNLESLFKIK